MIKRLILIAVIGVSLTACKKEKDWKCSMYHYEVGKDKGEPTNVLFYGTKEQMKKYESNNTKVHTFAGVDYQTEVKCK